jgi:hypothetical protein
VRASATGAVEKSATPSVKGPWPGVPGAWPPLRAMRARWSG